MKNLGFGMMRLPVISGPTDFDYAQLNEMVDAFLEAGYTYFDTSFVYHDGKSEEATRKALVERHPRENFTVATKFSWIISEWTMWIIICSITFRTSTMTDMTEKAGS